MFSINFCKKKKNGIYNDDTRARQKNSLDWKMTIVFSLLHYNNSFFLLTFFSIEIGMSHSRNSTQLFPILQRKKNKCENTSFIGQFPIFLFSLDLLFIEIWMKDWKSNDEFWCIFSNWIGIMLFALRNCINSCKDFPCNVLSLSKYTHAPQMITWETKEKRIKWNSQSIKSRSREIRST